MSPAIFCFHVVILKGTDTSHYPVGRVLQVFHLDLLNSDWTLNTCSLWQWHRLARGSETAEIKLCPQAQFVPEYHNEHLSYTGWRLSAGFSRSFISFAAFNLCWVVINQKDLCFNKHVKWRLYLQISWWDERTVMERRLIVLLGLTVILSAGLSSVLALSTDGNDKVCSWLYVGDGESWLSRRSFTGQQGTRGPEGQQRVHYVLQKNASRPRLRSSTEWTATWTRARTSTTSHVEVT